MTDIIRILKGIAVAVPVIVDEEVRFKERYYLRPFLFRRIEQLHPGVLTDRLQPALLQVRQWHFRFVPKRRPVFTIQQGPPSGPQCLRDGQSTLPESLFGDDLTDPPVRDRCPDRFLQDLRQDIVVASVDLMKHPVYHLRTWSS